MDAKFPTAASELIVKKKRLDVGGGSPPTARKLGSGRGLPLPHGVEGRAPLRHAAAAEPRA
jgi:hypothetical protein